MINTNTDAAALVADDDDLKINTMGCLFICNNIAIYIYIYIYIYI